MINKNLKFRVWNPYLEIFIGLEDLQDDYKYRVKYKPDFSIDYIPLSKTNKSCQCVVQKSIGHKDRNRLEIFEGDIVERHFYNNGEDEISIKIIDNKPLLLGEKFLDDRVIGNIFENPELIPK